jgi:alpha-tubulin suppressor-like RCC1 family protein
MSMSARSSFALSALVLLGLTWGVGLEPSVADEAESLAVQPTAMPEAMQRIAAGDGHSLAVKPDGSLWAWGSNRLGQLGDGTSGWDNYRATPLRVMSDVAAVAGSSHALALKTDGTLWAWGANTGGQLGDGTTDDRYSTVYVMDQVSAVAAGAMHSFALKTDGSLWGWGSNYVGQLGDGTTDDRSRPGYVTGGVAAVAAGAGHSLVLKTDGSLWACGRNYDGQLGHGSTIYGNYSGRQPPYGRCGIGG